LFIVAGMTAENPSGADRSRRSHLRHGKRSSRAWKTIYASYSYGLISGFLLCSANEIPQVI
jgi:hypothetical protein